MGWQGSILIKVGCRHLDINRKRHHDVYVRTTLTLEDDLAQRIADVARETRRPFKAVLNEALRRGLGEFFPPEPEFRIHPHAGRLQPGIDDRRFNELAWELEQERLPRSPAGRNP
jgi:hypothetical protein